MKKFLALLFLGSLSLVAQQRNTVYQQLGFALTTIPSSPFLVSNNVGQFFHSFTAVERTTTNTSCVADQASFPVSFAATIQASYDGINFFIVPNVRVSYTQGAPVITKLYRVSGAYPYIQMKVIAFPTSLTANCAVDINYTGSLEGSATSDASTSPSVITTSLLGYVGLIPYNTCTVMQALGTTNANTPSNVKVNILGFNYFPVGTNTTLNVYSDSTCSTLIGTYPAPNGNELQVPVDNTNLTPIAQIFLVAGFPIRFSVLINGSGTTGGYPMFFFNIAN